MVLLIMLFPEGFPHIPNRNFAVVGKESGLTGSSVICANYLFKAVIFLNRMTEAIYMSPVFLVIIILRPQSHFVIHGTTTFILLHNSLYTSIDIMRVRICTSHDFSVVLDSPSMFFSRLQPSRSPWEKASTIAPYCALPSVPDASFPDVYSATALNLVIHLLLNAIDEALKHVIIKPFVSIKELAWLVIRRVACTWYTPSDGFTAPEFIGIADVDDFTVLAIET